MPPPPRTACSTRATVRRARTACVRPCPPTCGPAPPGACCSAAGGTACAVSVRGRWSMPHPLTRLGDQGAPRPGPPGRPSRTTGLAGTEEGPGDDHCLCPECVPCWPSAATPTATCPKSLTYRYHISTCQATCRARSDEGDATCSVSFVPVDGCTCSNDTFLDDTGKCVPATSCPCYYRGSVVPNGESLHDGGAVW